MTYPNWNELTKSRRRLYDRWESETPTEILVRKPGEPRRPPLTIEELQEESDRLFGTNPTSEPPEPPAFTKSTYAGMLFGVAVGDAYGSGTLDPYASPPIGSFRLQPGEWTDDTALTLCTADSLFEADGFDPINHLDYLLRWLDTGYNSCKPYAYDIGGSIRRSLKAYRAKRAYRVLSPTGSGNGSLMRVAPIALWYALRPGTGLRY